MDEEIEQRNPLKVAAAGGAVLILAATVVKMVTTWFTFPGIISSVSEFFHTLLDSFFFVLNFEFKLWWVFLLILYMIARWYKKR